MLKSVNILVSLALNSCDLFEKTTGEVRAMGYRTFTPHLNLETQKTVLVTATIENS